VSNRQHHDADQERIERARAAWRFRGQERPSFAVPPGPGQESVWDYPRPPAIRPEPRLVEVHHAGALLARSQRGIRVCETGSPPTIYLPADDVVMDRLAVSARRSFCEWKGEARYFCLQDAPAQAVAWCYPRPLAGFQTYASWLCFYPGRVVCTLDGEPVQPQPGDYYGGWITSEVVGPFKGDPGTSHW
jgi:uncharacterized protein (DUF427 family)